MQSLRCFVAVALPDFARDAIAEAQESLRERVPHGYRWERTQNLHLTLKFLGDVPAHQAPAVSDACLRVAAQRSPGHLLAEKLDAFPNPKRPRVVVLTMTEADDVLSRIARDLEAEMEKLGFPREARAFRPHITIARARRDARPEDLTPHLARVELPPIGAIPVDEITLFESELSPRGATYTAMGAYPLEGREESAEERTDEARTTVQ